MINIINKETIPEELLGILEDFMELTVGELPNDLPHIREKREKVKVFNVRDDVIVFLHKDRFLVVTYNKLQPSKYDTFKATQKINDNTYMVALIDSINISNNFNVVGIHMYQEYEDLNQEENSWSSSSEEGRLM